MKKLIVMIALIITLSVPNITFAASWYYVGSNNEISVYLDNDSVIKDMTEALLMIKEVMPNGDMHIDMMQIRRDTAQYRIAPDVEWTSIKQGTVGAKLMDLIW